MLKKHSIVLILILLSICLLTACGGQTDRDEQTESAYSDIHDENGFETVGDTESAQDTGHSNEDNETESNDDDGGEVELPKMPI